MDFNDERDHEEELAVALEYEREQWEELGHERAKDGMSRRQAQQWLKVSATVNQARAFWRGFQRGAKAKPGDAALRRRQALLAVIDSDPSLTANELARKIKTRLDLVILSLRELENEGLIKSHANEDPRKVPCWSSASVAANRDASLSC